MKIFYWILRIKLGKYFYPKISDILKGKVQDYGWDNAKTCSSILCVDYAS